MIFRYFIEWLRVELREEAFQGYVKRAKRKAQSLKKQQQQHQQYQQQQQQKQKNKQMHPSQQQQQQQQKQQLPKDDSTWTSSYMPGWMTSRLADVSAEVDEWYDWLTDEEKAGRPTQKGESENSAASGSTGTNSNSNSNDNSNSNGNSNDDDDNIDYRQTQFWELAKLEGDEKWVEWLETHIWTVSFAIVCFNQ